MSNVSRNRILVIIIAILLVSNLVLLVLLLRMQKNNEAESKPGFTERLKKDVGFTPQQMSVFEPKKKAFWNDMRLRFDQMRSTKQEFYFQIYDPNVPDSAIENKALIIGMQQKDLDIQVIKHFKDVRKICKSDQLIKFDSLVPYIIQRMTALPDKRK